MNSKEVVLFSQMKLSSNLITLLEKKNFINATPVQAKTIPLALEGHDILGSAQTGTGKTLAFSIPVIQKLFEVKNSRVLILTPTRELAQQVVKAIEQVLGRRSSIRTALLIGGEPLFKQIRQLQLRPQIIVGTPGRVIDHFERKSVKTDNISFLVLDEMDRMLDMGFSLQLDEIITQLPKQRQTLMFSATIPKSIEQLTKKYLINPKRIAIGHESKPAENIVQEVVTVARTEKYATLMTELDKRDGSVIIFVKTRLGADRLARKLQDEKYKASAIHGNLRQAKRERVIAAFRKGRSRIMVATDIAARGLDIPHIQHVINYDLPQCPEDYIHRIGRTARAGKSGFALCLLTPTDTRQWKLICRRMDPNYKEEQGQARNKRGRFNKGKRFVKGRRSDKKHHGSYKKNTFKRDGASTNKKTEKQRSRV